MQPIDHRFNEAAGIPRGRRSGATPDPFWPPCFNEAAGIPRGRPGDRAVEAPASSASMRPRVFPAEDRKISRRPDSATSRFNEAAGIPRGRRRRSRSGRTRRRGFNEAAGIPRGRLVGLPGRGAPQDASMRPRVFPAEDLPLEPELVAQLRASMRPRVFPAEDLRAAARRQDRRGASMRPRVFPAEDVTSRSSGHPGRLASMRPRVFPAEDPGARSRSRRAPGRFNEAAGIPRGRLVGAWDRAEQAGTASMRPRVFPAEDAEQMVKRQMGYSCFNEAAGIPRGRRQIDAATRGGAATLQ